jgi:hypothetical protein
MPEVSMVRHSLPTLAVARILFAAPLTAQRITTGPAWAQDPPGLAELVDFARDQSDLRVGVTRYLEDLGAIRRRYEVQYSPVRQDRLRRFFTDWQRRLGELDFDGLNHEGQVDYILLRNSIDYELAMLELEAGRWREMSGLLPFADPLRALQESRHDRERVEPRVAAATLDSVAGEVERLTEALPERARATGRNAVSPTSTNRAAAWVAHLRQVLADWHRFYDGYDPLYSWWARGPFERLDSALSAYHDGLITHLVGIRPGDPGPIIGDPVMEQGLAADLAVEMIPYSAQELLAIGWREFEWTEQRFREVSRAMGFEDDWKAALEHVKSLAPPPGEKPWAIFDIADYSEAFIGDMDIVTIPPLAAEVWRLAMQHPSVSSSTRSSAAARSRVSRIRRMG